MKSHALVAVAIGATFLTVANIRADAAEVKMLGAEGMRQIMLDLGPRFERATGHTLMSTYDSTGQIVKRIEAGEDVDVVMINRSGIESLAKVRKVIAGSVTDVASSIAAVAVRKGAPRPDISSAEAFKRALLSAKSIARPSPAIGGSSGNHITKVLERLGITNEVNAKSVMYNSPEKMAGSPGDLVAKGQAEIALHPAPGSHGSSRHRGCRPISGRTPGHLHVFGSRNIKRQGDGSREVTYKISWNIGGDGRDQGQRHGTCRSLMAHSGHSRHRNNLSASLIGRFGSSTFKPSTTTFQTIHHCSVDVACGLVLLFGIGARALPLWDSRTRRNNWAALPSD